MLRRSKTDGGGPIPAEGAHILVVNDDSDAQELLGRLLERRGFKVSRCASTDDAMVSLGVSQPPVDLVLVDFHQGGTSQALKLLDQIRGHNDAELARTRVVMTTNVDENRMFSWQSGVDGFLVLPYHADELVGAICDALGRDDEERAAFRSSQMSSGRRSA